MRTPTLALMAACALPMTGETSWYGPGFAGRLMANGKPFVTSHLTAAHRCLPLGTKVLVTRRDTGASVEVTITDRGPYAHTERRILDLSPAAAAKLGMQNQGTAPIRLEPAPVRVADQPNRKG